MAEKNKALRSINAPGESRCVDLFVRPDGSYGFEEYRRDVEDLRGWFPVGGFGGLVFDSEDEALCDARAKVAWLNDALDGI